MYIVIELQTNDGVTSQIVSAYSTLSLAVQKYHQILSAAAVSSVDIHTALIVDEYGTTLHREFFNHKEKTE